MATVVVEGTELVVRLTGVERVGLMHGDVRVPLAAVRSVRVASDPWAELRGRRSQGTLVPGRVSLSVRKGPKGEDWVDFVIARRRQAALVVELGGAPYDRLVVSCPDATALADELGRITPAQ